jgi:hypothetical protein
MTKFVGTLRVELDDDRFCNGCVAFSPCGFSEFFCGRTEEPIPAKWFIHETAKPLRPNWCPLIESKLETDEYNTPFTVSEVQRKIDSQYIEHLDRRQEEGK